MGAARQHAQVTLLMIMLEMILHHIRLQQDDNKNSIST